MARKYTKGLGWHQNQTQRSLRSINKKNFAQMGCGTALTILAIGVTVLFIGWTQI